MKILDRYVIKSFLKNYAISFMVLVGMYVVLDMVFNFSNLVQFQPTGGAFGGLLDTITDIVDYYFYQCFLFFVHLSGIIPVVAAAFTLMRFSRFNELTAMLAAGVPLLRIATPIILVALALNALLLVDQEVIIPAMIPQLTRDHNDVHKSAMNSYPIQAMQDGSNGLVSAAKYYPSPSDGPPVMKDFDVIERVEVTRDVTDDAGNARSETVLLPEAHTWADEARWDPEALQWNLANGHQVSGLRPDEVRSRENPRAAYKAVGLTPEEISLYRSGKFVELLGTERINQLLLRPKAYGTLNLLRVKHWRFTQPLMNVILLLLAIPCVLTREPGRLKQAAAKCLFLTGLAMGTVFLSQQFAGSAPPTMAPDRWAALMAWMPVFLFGPLAVYLLDHVKT